MRNAGVTVPSFLMDDSLDAKKDMLMRGIQEYISTIPLFSISNNNRPCVNITSFMNKLGSSRLINHVISVDQFKSIMTMANDALRKKADDVDFVSKHKVSPQMKDKCVATGTYFGLEKSQEWIDTMFALPNTSTQIDLPLV